MSRTVSCSEAPDVPKALTKLVKKRKHVEQKRVQQLAKIAKALDTVAREELDFLSQAGSQAEQVKDADIQVKFVKDASELDTSLGATK